MDKKKHADYDSFVEKFKPKKTTDDCFTPPEVYDCVLSYVGEHIDLTKLGVVRPFYPGGDYQNFDYKPNSIVVDNPPFSILSQIVRWYTDKGIKFFLFAPHLTLFSSNQDCSYVICNYSVVYTNGAKVKTSFMTNIFAEPQIVVSGDLNKKMKDAQAVTKNKLPKYSYPSSLVTVSRLAKVAGLGSNYVINRKCTYKVVQLDAQKQARKLIFGYGFLLSKEEEARLKEDVIIWELSDREREIVNNL